MGTNGELNQGTDNFSKDHYYKMDSADEDSMEDDIIYSKFKDEFSSHGGKYKLQYDFSRKPLPEVDYDEEGIDEIVSRAKNLSKRLNSTFLQECMETRRSSRRHDRIAKTYLNDFVDDIQAGVPRTIINKPTEPIDNCNSLEWNHISQYHKPRFFPIGENKKYTSWQNKREQDSEDNDTKLAVREHHNRIEQKLSGILDYKTPEKIEYSYLRSALQKMETQLQRHRDMTDRYSGVDLNEKPELTAEERINRKADIVLKRMPHLATNSSAFHYSSSNLTDDDDVDCCYGSKRISNNEEDLSEYRGTSELRGRLRRLLSRTRNSSSSNNY